MATTLPPEDQALSLHAGAWKVIKRAQATGTTEESNHSAGYITICVRKGLAVREAGGVVRLTERGQRIADFLLGA